MTDSHAPFAPDWVSPPGDTIIDIADERGWTQAELAKRLGYTEKHVSLLINGKVSLTEEAAMRLESVLGSNAGFWLNREARYREHLARLAAADRHAGWVDWLDKLPVKDLMDMGAIPKKRLDARNKPTIVTSCLRFFGVASPEQWNAHYGAMQVAFRRSRAEQSDVGAISAWLRQGEREAEALDGLRFDRNLFEAALVEIRGLTREQPSVFEPRMRELLSAAGVAFVLVPAIPRAHVSGVARWLSVSRPMIQLSLYGKTNDKFWFTFFHEAAHILLHASTNQEKKSVFLDDPNAAHADDPLEHEANQWAADRLISPPQAAELPFLRTKDAVTAFAERIGIHPGIVVGRLQHDKLIEPSWMNDLKQSFRLTNAAHG